MQHQVLFKSEHNIVEVKARVDKLESVRQRLLHLTAQRIGSFRQIDHYFDVPKGKLKLRKTEERDESELIFYDRKDVNKIKESCVFIIQIQNPMHFEFFLRKVLGSGKIVKKSREIYWYKGTQIHLDMVESLGSFVELERKVSQLPNASKKNRNVLEKLIQKLEIDPKNLEEFSYSDLIEESSM